MKHILVVVDESFVAEDGTPFDAVVGALDFCNIPARVTEIDPDTPPSVAELHGEKMLSDDQRTQLIAALIDLVTESDVDHEILMDAVEFGRVGLSVMSDAILIETADTWSVDPLQYGIDEATLVKLRPDIAMEDSPEPVPVT